MEATGERFIPESMDGQIAAEHLIRYNMVCQLLDLRGKTVLDIASGSGYGTNLLAKSALRAFGVDISQEAVEYSSNRYQRDNLTYLVGSCLDIPLDADNVDVVVSFETIEHFENHDRFMSEIQRVLRPGGVLIMSSPNKRLYTDIPQTHNPYHVHELYTSEFRTMIQSSFTHALFFGQNYLLGSIIYPSDMTDVIQRATAFDIADGALVQKEHLYDIAIASNEHIQLFNCSFPLVFDITHTIEPTCLSYFQEGYSDGYHKCQTTPSFRLGHALLHPLSIFRRKKL